MTKLCTGYTDVKWSDCKTGGFPSSFRRGLSAMTDLRDHIEDIARAILGDPNPIHSTRSQWRYGTNGSIAVEIIGAQAGSWYDHELEKAREIGGACRSECIG